MNSRNSIKKAIQKYIYNRNRTHYLKWALNAEWSIRFFFVFDTRKLYVEEWVLKSHYLKEYIILSKSDAIDYIQKYSKNVNPIEYFSLNEFGKGYRRLVIDPKSGVDTFIE